MCILTAVGKQCWLLLVAAFALLSANEDEYHG